MFRALLLILATFMALPADAQVRKNVANLTAAEVASLRRGFEAMQARCVPLPGVSERAHRQTAAWRSSLCFWANIHGHWSATDPVPARTGMAGMRQWSPITTAETRAWDSCVHGTPLFLAWHRMMLAFFERTLRQASGDPSLMLPYWDVTANPQLPAIFRAQTYRRGDRTLPNPLYSPHRPRDINAGTAQISSGARNPANAMAATDFPTFSRRIESTPHGSVHCALGVGGCPTGRMGAVQSAATDPIFWFHHANIDRLAECHLRGRAMPLTAAQQNVRFWFPSASGTVAERRVGAFYRLDQLGYRYATGSSCGGATAAAQEPLERLWLAQASSGITIPRSASPRLRITGVMVDPLAPGMYEVHVVTPRGRAMVGVMSFFGGAHAHHGPEFDFSLRDAVRDLGLRPGDGFSVEFIPTSGVEPVAPSGDGPAAASAAPRAVDLPARIRVE